MSWQTIFNHFYLQWISQGDLLRALSHKAFSSLNLINKQKRKKEKNSTFESQQQIKTHTHFWLHTGFLAPIKRVISNMALSSHQIFILKQTSLLCLESRYNVPVWKGMWEVMEYYLWSKSNGKKKKCNCLMWNCNTWRITDNLLLFLHLGACTEECLMGRSVQWNLVWNPLFFCKVRVTHDKYKRTNTITLLCVNYRWGVKQLRWCKGAMLVSVVWMNKKGMELKKSTVFWGILYLSGAAGRPLRGLLTWAYSASRGGPLSWRLREGGCGLRGLWGRW